MMSLKFNRLAGLMLAAAIVGAPAASAWAQEAPPPAEAMAAEAPMEEAAPVAEAAPVEEAPAEEAAAEEAAPTNLMAHQQPLELDAAATGWVLVSSALVLLMTIPGLALFYGGMVRKKNLIGTVAQSFAITALVTVLWMAVGYGMAFGVNPNETLNAYVGSFDVLFLNGVTMETAHSATAGLPEYLWIMFQLTFAIITPALIAGAFAERMKFSAMLLFMGLWSIFVYAPVCHWVWGGGFLGEEGVLDFAGGTVVHINAGVAALVGALILGARKGYKTEPMPPHSLTLTLVGAGLLWVGWFGFNAGSNLESNGYAGLAMLNTLVCTAAAGLSWIITEKVTRGKASMLGLASGLVAGLVAVTPAAGFAGPVGAIVLGLIVSPICVIFCSSIKNALKYDDSLDAFGIHAIGGIVGAIATGILVSPALGGAGIVDYTTCLADGDISTCDAATYAMGTQVLAQIKGVLVTIVWSSVASAIVFFLIKYTIGLRVAEETEEEGLDIVEHGERAYHA